MQLSVCFIISNQRENSMREELKRPVEVGLFDPSNGTLLARSVHTFSMEPGETLEVSMKLTIADEDSPRPCWFRRLFDCLRREK